MDWLGGIFTTALEPVVTFFNNFYEGLKDFFVYLFVPPTDYWENQTTQVHNNFMSKFPFIEVMQNLFGVGLTEASTFSINFIAGTVISFDWFLPYRAFVKVIMGSFFTLLGLFYIIKRLSVQFVSNG